MKDIEKNNSNSRLITIILLIFMILIISGLLFTLFKAYEVSNTLKAIVHEDIALTDSLTKITEYQLEQAIRFERAERFGGESKQNEQLHVSFNQAVKSFYQYNNLIHAEFNSGKKLLEKLYTNTENIQYKQKYKQLADGFQGAEMHHGSYEKEVKNTFALIPKGQITLSYIEQIETAEDKLDKAIETLLYDIEQITFAAVQRAEQLERHIEYILAVLVLIVLISGFFVVQKINSIFVKLETAKKEIEVLHKQTKESIEYASIIQRAILPNENILKKHFKDFFTLWQPRDIVGGDIYLIQEINEDEIMIILIDCTGHGIPGAFVTMLVKAIEQQISALIKYSAAITPAAILSQFNHDIKKLLQQENQETESNVGLDGLVVHINQKTHELTFSGANTPLFICQNDKLNVIKGDKHSIAYKSSDIDFEFTNHVIDISSPTKIYMTTDGFIDQTGGAKGFPYGTKKFKKLIESIATQTFASQRKSIIEELLNYENQRKDDVTIIGGQL